MKERTRDQMKSGLFIFKITKIFCVKKVISLVAETALRKLIHQKL